MSRPLRCFILAAGFGERLRPITEHIPKPLLPVLGRPLLQIIIEKMLALGVGNIGINAHYRKEMIRHWLNAAGFGSGITLFEEDPILDTGGALRNAADFLGESDFIVHNGDIISDIDLSAVLDYHRRNKSIATLAVRDQPQYNNVFVDQQGLLKGVGKSYKLSGTSEHPVAFTGVAVYSPEFLEFIPEGVSSVVDAWLRAVKSGHNVGTYDVSGCSWSDIGSPPAYAVSVIQELKRQGEIVYIDPGSKGCGDIEIGGNSVIETGASLGTGSSLRNCIVLPGGKTEAGRIYENCIVGSGFDIALAESIFSPSSEKGTLIGTGGSDRQYFRIKKGSGTIVSMECTPADPDFTRHVEYTVFFRKYGIPVPEILVIDRENKSASFEDLGDISLYTWLKCPRSDEEVETVYRRILDILVRLHCEASEHVTECPPLSARIFDYDYLRWETGYFMERFVRGLKGVDKTDINYLEDEFHRLALKTDSFTKRIIHRDFQSQNIMITRGDIPRVIDFQGARLAPPAYDLASVLWDPYAPMKSDTRDKLSSYYFETAGKTSGNWFEPERIMESLLYCRLQRHMQALGAYGFLSTGKGKSYFLKHVPECMKHLEEEAALARQEFPSLYDLVVALASTD